MQGFVDSRSRLELFLAGDGRSGTPERPTAFEVDFDDAGSEFGDVVDDPPSESAQAEIGSELKTEDGAAVERKGGRGGEEQEALTWEDFGDVADGADGECCALLLVVTFVLLSVHKICGFIYLMYAQQNMPSSFALLRFNSCCRVQTMCMQQ